MIHIDLNKARIKSKINVQGWVSFTCKQWVSFGCKLTGVHIGLSESEVNWRTFFRSLQERGLSGVKLIISDDHSGLKAARMAEFPAIPWQRCFFHLQQNAQSYVPNRTLKKTVAREIRDIVRSPDLDDAQGRLKRFVSKYEKKAPKLAQWAENDLPESFTFFQFPAEHWDKIRTSNVLERINKEIRRRTKVIGVFPNSGSYLRLASSILIDLSEKWLKEPRYMPQAE
jgi:transposase-like protein